MQYIHEAEIAIAAAKQAASLCESVRHSVEFASVDKPDRSPVTIADFAAQAVICYRLNQAFPKDAIVAEESAALLYESPLQLTKVTKLVQSFIPDATPDQVTAWIDLGQGKVGERFWTLDPIDGTKGFLRGDQYAIAIALIESGEVKLGVMACPGMDELFMAIRGQGTRRISLKTGESQPIRVAAGNCLAESVETSHGNPDRQRSIAQAVGLTSRFQMDSQAKYGAIASGHAALYLRLPWVQNPNYRENIWDHAVGAIIVEEAGGCVTDMNGQPLNFSIDPQLIENRGIVASNGMIHEAVLRAITQTNIQDDSEQLAS
ncbi:inositol monophosphatase family protein [Pseudanabaenaceae cyanobacterium LEGE 13415]|nr:inositol monophosphatase family protein [Pseudanabaenaceae cyanobacterium LEGE 13415]